MPLTTKDFDELMDEARTDTVSEIESLRQQITELQKKCRAADEVIDFYASNNWNSAKYKDGPVFFAEERGGAAARQFQKDYPKTEITQEEA